MNASTQTLMQIYRSIYSWDNSDFSNPDIQAVLMHEILDSISKDPKIISFIMDSLSSVESPHVPPRLRTGFVVEQEKIVNTILCADTEGKRYANLEELQRLADVAASTDQDALAKAEYLLDRLKEHVDTHFKAITGAISNPAYNNVSEQDKRAFQQKYKHLHTELSGEINDLRASISDEQRKQVHANKPSSSTESLIRQTAAMSDYVNAILPSQNRSESTAANTNPLKTLIASKEQIREANAAYVKAQPTPSKMEKAKRIGLLVLGVVAAAALLVVGVGACVATAGVAVPVITGLGLTTATTVGIGAGGAAAGTAAAIVTGVYAGSSSDGSRKRKNTDHLTDATTKVAKTACPFQSVQQQAEEITPSLITSEP